MTTSAVVFLCGRNAVRSPMAEALWCRTFGEHSASSYGLEPAGLPDGFMITVMAELGLDLSNFECRDMADAKAVPISHVICLADVVFDQAQAFAEAHKAKLVSWPIADPTLVSGDRETKLSAYREARDAIARLIEQESAELV